MKKVKIIINEQEFEAELNDTKTAKEIYKALPIEARGNFWGDEIYFTIPVDKKNENPTEDLKVGDLAYWPSGSAFCIFYGQTPASTNSRPRPASPVTVIGKIKTDLQKLQSLKKAKVRVDRA